ncbi:hypothetical protein PRZ48_014796 [Zasmidium cellare]|uniref:Glycoside hydrolase family 16 protein n=1 Tax=Zasmidium cellare TaxID=395010 RepID=A0ABR0DZT9_ZASCE|nr:hypothetical protein PRZ48_014796 [Zasmidium cellare]
METFYWTLDCFNLTQSWQPPGYNGTNTPEGWSTWSGGNGIILDYEPPGASNGNSLEANCQTDPYDPEYVPRTLAYNAWDRTASQFGALCTIRTSDSSQKLDPAASKPGVDHARWPGRRLQLFLNTITVKSSATPSPVQGYLLDPSSPASPRSDGSMTSIPKETFAIRLAQLLNTYWSITAGPYAVPYGFAGDVNNTNPAYNEGQAANATTTTAQLTRTFDVIRCHRAWLGVLLGSSVFLIAASILTIALRLRSKTPDLSLNWSTLTRDNLYVETSYASSSLDDAKRARLMKDKKVRFGDVEPEREVGHLAVGSLGTKGVARVDKRRVFD